MPLPRMALHERLQQLRHPGGMSLTDAARRLGVAEGRVAEFLAGGDATLPGDAATAVRLAPDPEPLLTTLFAGGPVAIGAGEAGIGGWRLASRVTVVWDRPAVRLRWDGAELIVPAGGLHAYALTERTGCRCGERRSLAWYDATGQPLLRVTQRIEADPAAFAACRLGHADARPATWSAGLEPLRQPADPGRCRLPLRMLSRIAAELHLARDPLTLVLGQNRYLLVQHAAWQTSSTERMIGFSDGPGWIRIWQDAVTDLAIVQVAAPGPLHAIEVRHGDDERGLAILPQQAPDGTDPDPWAACIARWRTEAL